MRTITSVFRYSACVTRQFVVIADDDEYDFSVNVSLSSSFFDGSSPPQPCLD